ncbi:MAG: hypothetical protein LAP85_08345 [Acidobacteriia bacterium]|nr:hypothetical protein [Terriglobia bacterium]
MKQMQLLRPPPLCPGDTIGIFTPSTPANVIFREKYLYGLEVLRRLGFRVVEGEVTSWRSSEGYRSGSPQQRAREFILYFPALEGNILLIEELRWCHSLEERALRQLERIGVFDVITGLIVGKPEFLDPEGAPFSYEDLILEIVGAGRPYPIVTNFDCGHTHPMLTIAEMAEVTLRVGEGFDACVIVEEPMVAVAQD